MQRRLVILGAGESGMGAALLGKKEGYEVFVSSLQIIEMRYKQVLQQEDIAFEEDQHSLERLLKADLVMKSPGIPEDAPVVVQLREARIKIISEIEFASLHTHAMLIGITGSNGKTTVTSWIHYILQNAGIDAVLAGNIGDSFAKNVARKSNNCYVLELSSFQLDGIETFKPHIAVLTNITPDHLDRYHNQFESYIAAKFRIVKNQTQQDYFIYDADDPVINNWLSQHEIKSIKIPLSSKELSGNGAFLKDDELHIKINESHFTMAQEDIALKGIHNTKNAMAASAVAQLLKIRKQTIKESLQRFHGVEHRLERVLNKNKVSYINDSKATNINATYYALDSVKADTIWIVGGVDKGNDYTELLALVNEKVKAIICLGVDNQKLINSFNNCVDTIVETQKMQEAVSLAHDLAKPGDTVLLSPACASFDLFKNYEDRGNQFKEAVLKLK
ncbi:UDP-N-acetylmuramoyl-L-alanine--D-glutamate ligase [Mesonia sp. HuA40]|uniref:UDP-N-acetylmuramoyl-L-alanine--D-glutamate ligase n=1 Tax=Mesonia sp. HuA40 TaxID=2602761 RepID=UPI0011CBE876|nr:UDP-N-acetylmuramoyl-L-alanine--D-glutamate ligase [Mesonia sp. HuA40]TXK73693.1 UDP-N-acetylmuramoyl-L-alanine--D-glutamate ligase [Mesonia sp. HuA40]